MNFPINFTTVDIIFVIFIIIMMIIGYIKGFVVRLYDFLATIGALLLALFLSGPLSQMFSLYTMDGIAAMFGSMMNRIFIFGLLFSGLKLVFWILGKFVKPAIKTMVSNIGFINKFDSVLGAILSALEGILFTYLLLLIAISPIYSNGKEVIEDTMITKHVLNITPSLSKEIMKLTDDFRMVSDIIDQGINYHSLSSENSNQMLSMLSMMDDFGMLSNEQLDMLLSSYSKELEKVEGEITLTQENYETLQKLLNQLDNTQIDKDKIYEKIKVSE